MSHGTDERGQVGGIEAVVFGLLVIVGATLLIANAWGLVDAKLAARTSARDAARTFAKAPTSDPGVAAATADQVARETLRQLGWRRHDISVVNQGSGFSRCALVSYVVTVPVPVFHLPFLHPAGPTFSVTAHHSERVDPYRSGVPGPAQPACG